MDNIDDPNKKLIEDFEFTKQLILKDTSKDFKNHSERPNSWLPEKFNNDSGERRNTKRYKTDWEAGKGNHRDERKKSPSNKRFTKNTSKDFKSFSGNSEKNYRTYRSRKEGFSDKNERDNSYNKKPWVRNSDKPTNYAWKKGNRYDNYNKTSYGHRDYQKNEKYNRKTFNPRENSRVQNNRWDGTEREKVVHGRKDSFERREDKKNFDKPEETVKVKQDKWKMSTSHGTNNSEVKGGYTNNNVETGVNNKIDRNFRNTNTPRYSNSKWNQDSQHGSKHSNKDRGRGMAENRTKEHLERQWKGNDAKSSKWKNNYNKQPPYETRKYRDKRDSMSSNYEDRKKFKTHNFKHREKPEGYQDEGFDNLDEKAPHNSKNSKYSEKENDTHNEIRPMKMVGRREWGAPKTKWGIGPPLILPIKHIFCLPTERNRCFNIKQCTRELLYLHGRHTSTKTCPDIKYSFFIGTNGVVHECRGWRTRPGLPKAFEKMNKSSLFIALAGKFNQYNIPDKMINARDYVIKYGLKNAYIDKNYILQSAVDHATMHGSEADSDQKSDSQDHDTDQRNDHGSEDQGSESHRSEDKGIEDHGSEDQGTEGHGSEYQTTEDEDYSQEDKKNFYKDDEENMSEFDSNWEDKFKDISLDSVSTVKSWESYSSSWDIKEDDLVDDASEGEEYRIEDEEY